MNIFSDLIYLRSVRNYTFKSHSERQREIGEITPKIATQGKTWKNNEVKNAAAYAIDKDFSTSAVTETDDGAGWLKLEFDKSYFIHRVVIYYMFYTNWYNSSDWCAKSEANFRSCVTSDNNVDVSVYQGGAKQKSCGTLQLTYGLEQSDQIYTLICRTRGDTVKLSKNSGFILVNEVAVTTTTTGTKYDSKTQKRIFFANTARVKRFCRAMIDCKLGEEG